MTGFDPENFRSLNSTPVGNEGIVFDVRVGQLTFDDGPSESSGVIPCLAIEFLVAGIFFMLMPPMPGIPTFSRSRIFAGGVNE